MIPELPAPYDLVLQEALDELKGKPVKAILLAGSAASGKLRPPASDLDILVIDESPWTVRHERRHGIDLHWTFGSEATWRAVWQREAATDLGANISLMAGSIQLSDPEGLGEQLRTEAQALYAAGPRLSPQWLGARRRWLTDLAHDLLEAEPASQPYICSLLVFMAVPCALALNGQFQPRHKEAMGRLVQANPTLFGAIDCALRGQNVPAYTNLHQAIGNMLESHGGWLHW